MKHTLQGRLFDRKVWLDGKILLPGRSQQIWNHSPDGFNWGYSGSGPAQLALAIVLELTGQTNGYQNFKEALIAGLPHSDFKVEFDSSIIKEIGG